MTKGRDMAMGVERSKALHNFAMPGDLRWGNQRHLRCMRVNSDSEIPPMRRRIQGSSYYSYNQSIQQRRTVRDRDSDLMVGEFTGGFVHGSPVVGPTSRLRRGGDGADEDEDEIAAMREKVISDLETAAERLKDAMWRDEGLEEEREFSTSRHPLQPPPPPPLPPPPPPSSDRPWNLRTRRAACKKPIAAVKNGASSAAAGNSIDVTTSKIQRFDSPRPNSGSSQIRSSAAPSAAATTHRSTIQRIDGGDKMELTKFSVPLLKREIEEDFFAMVGHRPPRRPKKRTKSVQRDLDTLFPGLWLTEITADMYRVAEAAP